jgi:hypothetical protein
MTVVDELSSHNWFIRNRIKPVILNHKLQYNMYLMPHTRFFKHLHTLRACHHIVAAAIIYVFIPRNLNAELISVHNLW